MDWLEELASKAQRPPVTVTHSGLPPSCLHAGITHVDYCTLLFLLGILTQVFIIVWQALY